MPSLTEGHLGYFHILTVMDKASVNILVQVLCEYMFSTPLGKDLALMVRVCLVL